MQHPNDKRKRISMNKEHRNQNNMLLLLLLFRFMFELSITSSDQRIDVFVVLARRLNLSTRGEEVCVITSVAPDEF
jgi:hypothetical protein